MPDLNCTEQVVTSLSIIIPAFNEEGCIQSTLRQLRETLEPIVPHIEWILVDDGSTDGTRLLMEQLSYEYHNIKICCHVHNEGLGSSIITGIKSASRDWVLWIPSDGQFPESAIGNMLKFNNENGIALLIRDGSTRAASRKILTTVLRYLLGSIAPQVPINYSGIFMCRRSQVVFPSAFIKSGIVTFTIAQQCINQGAPVSLFSCVIRHRTIGKSKVFNVRTVLRTFTELLYLHLTSFSTHQNRGVL